MYCLLLHGSIMSYVVVVVFPYQLEMFRQCHEYVVASLNCRDYDHKMSVVDSCFVHEDDENDEELSQVDADSGADETWLRCLLPHTGKWQPFDYNQ